jgi:CHAT domain-containing protein
LILVFLCIHNYASAQADQIYRFPDTKNKFYDQGKLIEPNELEKQAKRLMDEGKYSEALPLREKVLTVFENEFGPDHPDVAWCLNNLAMTHSSMANHEKALPLKIRALEIYEKILGEEHSYTTIASNNLAITYFKLAQFDKALIFQLRALAIDEKSTKPEYQITAVMLENIALTYLKLAQFDKALPFLIRASEINEKTLGSKHLGTGFSWNNLALAYASLGQHEKALPLQIRVLEILENTLGAEHPDTATATGNLALSYQNLGQNDKALPLLIRSLTVQEKILGPEHPDTALSLSNLAATFSDLKMQDQALSLAIRSLSIREKIFGQEHPDTATALNNLSSIYIHLNYYDKGLPLKIRALTIREIVLGANHPDTAMIRADLGFAILRANNSDSGLALLKSAINSLQGQRQLVSHIGASELKSYSESISCWYQKLADALIERGRLPEAQQVLDMLKEDEQFDFIRRAPNADPRTSRIGYTIREQDWLKRYREISDQLGKLGAESRELVKQANLGLTAEQNRRLQAIMSDLKVAKLAFQDYLGQMRENLAEKGQARKVEVEEVSTQSMRQYQLLVKNLSDDVALLQFYVTDKRVGMLLTTSGVQLARSKNIDSEELSRMVSELRRLLQNPKSNPVPTAQRLYNILMAPIAKDLDDAKIKTVMLSLDGVLRYLPFSALHDGQQYLIQRWNLPLYTSVTRGKLLDSVSAQWQAVGLGVTKAWPEFSALAGVKSEITAIVKTPYGGLMPGEIYLDEEFTATQFKAVSQRKFPLMHVASHFRFSPGTEVNSFLLLGDGQRLTIGDIRTQNYRFDNVDLMTLSACDTGLGGGRDEQGKEIEGFGVIAQQQGAKSVLATLWQVSDQSTAMLMADLYRRRQSDKLTKVEALRQSQISLQASLKYSHPFYWAPFILMGNWK